MTTSSVGLSAFRTAARSALLLAVLALVVAPRTIEAQELRGTVMQSNDSTPASGAVVVLLHATKDSIYERTVTGERGLFTLKVPAATPVRLRVLRLGYQATNVGTYTLTAGQTETVRVRLGESRVVLATLDIKTANRCDVRPDSARLVGQLYEEARKALMASASPVSNTRNVAQFTLFSRAQDERGKLVAPIERSAFTGPSSKPFASLSGDSLAKVGYVLEQSDGTVYRAPDADVLLADAFLATHCLQFVQGTGERAASVGIGFRSVNRPRKLVDVRGTLWLDRETSELQYLEYSYEGTPAEFEKFNVGGRVDYTQMAAGLWFVNKWAIRMPRYVARSNQRLDGMRGELAASVELVGLQITGGEVQSVKVDDEILYSNSGAYLVGSEPRDLQDLRVTAGSFDVAKDVAQVGTPIARSIIDSVFSTSACTDAATPEYAGQVTGRVRTFGMKNVEPMPVIAEWKEDFRVSGQRDFLWQYRRLETRTSANGSYVLCGLPLARPVTLTATSNGRKSRVATVRVTDRSPRTNMDISIGDNIGAVLTAADVRGKGAILVISNISGQPVAHAQVTLGGGITRIADLDGRVVVNAAPKDSLPVFARRIGYAAFEGKALRDSTGGEFRITMLPSAQTLKTVNVISDHSGLERTGFYERVAMVQRGAVLGEFMTPEELDRRSFARVTNIVEASKYAQVQHFMGKPINITGRGGCLMNVIIDGVREQKLETFTQQTPSLGTEMGSIPANRSGGTRMSIDDLVSGANILAIEIYPTAANAPMALASKLLTNSGCGIIAIWTGAR